MLSANFFLHRSFSIGVSTFICTVTLAFAGLAAELPEATKKDLARLRLDASIMNGLDAELEVPKSWLEGAAKEKDVVILGTWQEREFLRLSEPFRKRYPSIKLNHQRGAASGIPPRRANLISAFEPKRTRRTKKFNGAVGPIWPVDRRVGF